MSERERERENARLRKSVIIKVKLIVFGVNQKSLMIKCHGHPWTHLKPISIHDFQSFSLSLTDSYSLIFSLSLILII